MPSSMYKLLLPVVCFPKTAAARSHAKGGKLLLPVVCFPKTAAMKTDLQHLQPLT